MVFIEHDALEECKLFMKVDTDADDALIAGLMSGAAEYLRNAGVEESWTELYKLALHSLTLHWYDHRNDVDTDKVMPQGLRPVINQLKAEGYVARAGGL